MTLVAATESLNCCFCDTRLNVTMVDLMHVLAHANVNDHCGWIIAFQCTTSIRNNCHATLLRNTSHT
jgi:hypothetical protein